MNADLEELASVIPKLSLGARQELKILVLEQRLASALEELEELRQKIGGSHVEHPGT